jgi:hypothetical protein
VEVGGEERRVGDRALQAVGEDGLYLPERLLRGLLQLGVGPGHDDARPEDERLELPFREHQRRDVEAAREGVADPRLADHGDPREREVPHVAVDRPGRDAERAGELRRRRDAATAQLLDEAEEAVGAAHGASILPASRPP